MERLVVLVSRLSQAQGRPVGADELLALVHYGSADPQDARDQLRRDLTPLRALGWDIANVAGPGQVAQWRLSSVDARLRVELTPEQRFELLRVAKLASLPGFREQFGGTAAEATDATDGTDRDGAYVPADTDALAVLDQVAWAREHRCLIRFRYLGRERVAHPYSLTTTAGGWYLGARLEGEQGVKYFLLTRMSEVRHDDPGTSEDPPAAPVQLDLDPIRWQRDAPVHAIVETTRQHRPHVEAMLGEPVRVEPDRDADRPESEAGPTASGRAAGDEPVVLTIVVTSREAFHARLCQLGRRARLLGPAELRADLRARLQAVVDGGES